MGIFGSVLYTTDDANDISKAAKHQFEKDLSKDKHLKDASNYILRLNFINSVIPDGVGKENRIKWILDYIHFTEKSANWITRDILINMLPTLSYVDTSDCKQLRTQLYNYCVQKNLGLCNILVATQFRCNCGGNLSLLSPTNILVKKLDGAWEPGWHFRKRCSRRICQYGRPYYTYGGTANDQKFTPIPERHQLKYWLTTSDTAVEITKCDNYLSNCYNYQANFNKQEAQGFEEAFNDQYGMQIFGISKDQIDTEEEDEKITSTELELSNEGSVSKFRHKGNGFKEMLQIRPYIKSKQIISTLLQYSVHIASFDLVGKDQVSQFLTVTVAQSRNQVTEYSGIFLQVILFSYLELF